MTVRQIQPNLCRIFASQEASSTPTSTAYCRLATRRGAVKNTFVRSPHPTNKGAQNRSWSALLSAPSPTGLCKTHTKRTGTSSTLLSPFTLAFRSPSCFSCFSGARKPLKPVQQCHKSSEVLAQRLEPLSCLRHPIPSCQIQPGGGRNAAPVHRRGRCSAPPAICS